MGQRGKAVTAANKRKGSGKAIEGQGEAAKEQRAVERQWQVKDRQ